MIQNEKYDINLKKQGKHHWLKGFSLTEGFLIVKKSNDITH